MLGKASNRFMITHTPASGLMVWRGLRRVHPVSALAFISSFCRIYGQCTMCRNSATGDWTYWNADCHTWIGDKCVSEMGDWITWDVCCSANNAVSSRQKDLQPVSNNTDMGQSANNAVSNRQRDLLQPVSNKTNIGQWLMAYDWVNQLIHKRPDATLREPNSIVGLSQMLPATGSCDCLQVRQTGGCSLSTTSKCSEQCCIESSCECSWARFGCGSPDGSRCWDQCCIQSTEACDCNFARAGGCVKLDYHRECWDTCCAGDAQASSVREWTRQKLCGLVFTSPWAWGCVAALGVLLLHSRRVMLATGRVTAKALWKPVVADALEEDMRGLVG